VNRSLEERKEEDQGKRERERGGAALRRPRQLINRNYSRYESSHLPSLPLPLPRFSPRRALPDNGKGKLVN